MRVRCGNSLLFSSWDGPWPSWGFSGKINMCWWRVANVRFVVHWYKNTLNWFLFVGILWDDITTIDERGWYTRVVVLFSSLQLCIDFSRLQVNYFVPSLNWGIIGMCCIKGRYTVWYAAPEDRSAHPGNPMETFKGPRGRHDRRSGPGNRI